MRKCHFILLLAILSFACSRVPKHVLDRKQMEQVLYDVHLTESYMDQNPSRFSTPQERSEMILSVYARHHITKETFDTSMVWYGAHLDVFMKIYGNVYGRLSEKNDSLKVAITHYERSMMTQTGDTVDIWKGARSVKLDPTLLATNHLFEIKGDTNFHKKDSLVLRMKLINMPSDSTAYIVAGMGYSLPGDKNRFVSSVVSENGWYELPFIADSTLLPKYLYGNITMIVRDDSFSTPVFADSISLVRYKFKGIGGNAKGVSDVSSDGPKSNVKVRNMKLEETKAVAR